MKTKILNKKLILMFLFVSLLVVRAQVSYAHGEDKPGPHNGYVRMPGPFHTEIVEASGLIISVYLLDMEWKNPTVAKSRVSLKVTRNAKDIPFTCKPEKNFFKCSLPSGVQLKAGDKVAVVAIREGIKGGEVVYNYPFKRPTTMNSHH